MLCSLRFTVSHSVSLISHLKSQFLREVFPLVPAPVPVFCSPGPCSILFVAFIPMRSCAIYAFVSLALLEWEPPPPDGSWEPQQCPVQTASWRLLQIFNATTSILWEPLLYTMLSLKSTVTSLCSAWIVLIRWTYTRLSMDGKGGRCHLQIESEV